jgi:hypothetical protein
MTEPVDDFLDSDASILGQNYVCLSFVSPEKFLKQKEMYLFHKYMLDKFRDYSQVIDVLSKKHLKLDTEDLDKMSDEEINNDINKKLVKELREKAKLEFEYTYNQFKTNYGDFMYRSGERHTEEFDKSNDYKTSTRALKVRGVYESYKEAEVRAKALQRRDQNFHVFVGTVGAWLPWDPEADKVQNEEYLNEELNTLIKEYKKNQVHKDMLYEQEKEDRRKDQMKKKIAEDELEKQEKDNAKHMATIEDNLETDDPWVQRANAVATGEETTGN